MGQKWKRFCLFHYIVCKNVSEKGLSSYTFFTTSISSFAFVWRWVLFQLFLFSFLDCKMMMRWIFGNYCCNYIFISVRAFGKDLLRSRTWWSHLAWGFNVTLSKMNSLFLFQICIIFYVICLTNVISMGLVGQPPPREMRIFIKFANLLLLKARMDFISLMTSFKR